jgi:hypothetical protein
MIVGQDRSPSPFRGVPATVGQDLSQGATLTPTLSPDTACRSIGTRLALRPQRCPEQSGRLGMSDVIYIGLALVFFAVSWAFVRLCDRV